MAAFLNMEEDMFFNIEEELKKLPGQPGVYLMHDDTDEIIYVGKAISLKNRVRQYFQASRTRTPKIEQMVSKIRRFEYIVTDSELEALILENNLIKSHQPKYNTMLKDDKTYPFIRLTVGEDFPRIMLARQMKKDKSKYYGPYTSSGGVKDTIELLTKLYRIRTCNRSLPKDIGKGRPCLNYEIHRCDAPCMGYVDKEEYMKMFKKVQDFLNGNYDEIISMLESKMLEASEKLEYEEAAEYRDQLNSVKSVAQKQKITSHEFEDRDIIAYSADGPDAVVQVFFIRQGKLLGREHFHLTTALQNSGSELLSSFIKQYYAGTPYIPRQLLVQQDIEDANIIEQWLTKKKGQKVSIKSPKKGEKEKLVELAKKNATMVLVQDSEKIKREELRTTGAMKEISDWLDLGKLKRVEAYDISNTNGFESVGSMIVYEDGRPRRSDYRKFKIKWVKGADDYSSMDEVLSRRFEHGLKEIEELKLQNLDYDLGKFTKFPDLIMMDGGRGQVNVALKVLEKYNLDIPVCGMVKDDHHRTRGLYFNNIEIPIKTNSEGFRLITRIQDEAHRFAIEYHRSLRSKQQVHSILDDIDEIGETRRRSLMKTFKSVENIKNATLDELQNAPSMNERAAQKVYDFFH